MVAYNAAAGYRKQACSNRPTTAMATNYLSSTYEDLKDHRRVIFEAL
ncbi:MAG: hypothetical protein OJF52_002548 [Nitrospira sp.]|jgi:hypothetical protein|nr:MAG: hypothetical protein OJF52_002548 [Nitrospira sp.]